MRLEVELELRDVPGQLSQALATVSRFGGNVSSVLHEHDKKRGDAIPVRLVFDAPADAATHLMEALQKEFQVLNVTGLATRNRSVVLVLGHVFESQIEDLTDAAFAAGAQVRRLAAEIASKEEPSAVLMEIAAPSAAVLDQALARVAAVAVSKGLTCVEALEAGS